MFYKCEPVELNSSRLYKRELTNLNASCSIFVVSTGHAPNRQVHQALHITGITTASTIWLVAAVGMVIGLGFPFLGFLVASGATILLFLLRGIELHWGFGSKSE